MSLINEIVHHEVQHTHIPTPSKGVGQMSKDKKEKYAATYHYGETVVHVVAPPPMTEEEKNKILREYHLAGWAIVKELNRNGKIHDLI